MNRLAIELVQSRNGRNRNKTIKSLFEELWLASLPREHLRSPLRVPDIGELLHLGFAQDEVNQSRLVIVAELYEREFPELRQGNIQESVVHAVLVPTTVAKPHVVAVVHQEKGKRALLVAEEPIA